MANWYVSTTGDDVTGNGSFANPYATIGVAETAAGANDIIHLMDGTYTMAPFSATKPVTITSFSQDYRNVVVKPTSFTTSPGVTGAFGELNGNGVDNGTYIIKHITWYLDTSVASVPTDTYISMFIRRNPPSCDIRVVWHNCYFVCTNPFSFSSKRYVILWGYDENSSNACYVYKCTFYGPYTNVPHPAEGYWHNPIFGQITDVNDCIFYMNNFRAPTFTSNYNCIYDNRLDSPVLGANDITSDPLIDVGDGSVDTSSPCVDSGVIVPTYVTQYYGSLPDIGCYEIVPESSGVMFGSHF